MLMQRARLHDESADLSLSFYEIMHWSWKCY